MFLEMWVIPALSFLMLHRRRVALRNIRDNVSGNADTFEIQFLNVPPKKDDSPEHEEHILWYVKH